MEGNGGKEGVDFEGGVKKYSVWVGNGTMEPNDKAFGRVETIEHLCGELSKLWGLWCDFWSVAWTTLGDAKTLWLLHNEIIFWGKHWDIKQAFDHVKLRVASWGKAKWPNMMTNISDFALPQMWL
ncbi:Uncharacterized protein TCM_027944 [Theobroma cacao]|uniref:Uncharacterized protein n=1 Tax=Theobroma cacao TaxID=3641 RepID=A0A061G9Y0_THECC|nr:Uncharacterized protein TCM_027944 [Theobroma cacao]